MRIFLFVSVSMVLCSFFLSSVKAQQIGQSFPLYAPTLSNIPTTTETSAPSPAPTRAPLDAYIHSLQSPTLSPLNAFQYVVRIAIDRGIRPQVIVLLILFPVVATIVAFSRHVIGLSGFSIYTPAALSVVLLSTGVLQGVVLFIALLVVAFIGKQILSVLKLEYIPRTAMLLWFVTLGMFLAIFFSTLFPFQFFMRVDVFPLLILVLLSEDFMALQGEIKWQESLERSIQIMILSVIGALIIGNLTIQEFAIIHPEIIIAFVGISNFLIGKYLGLRLTEYFRFQPIIDAEE